MRFTTQVVLTARMEPDIPMPPEELHPILITGIQLLRKPLQQLQGFYREHILFALLMQTDVLPAAPQQFSIHRSAQLHSDVTHIILQAAIHVLMELHIHTHRMELRLILLAGVMEKQHPQQLDFYREHILCVLQMHITALPAAQQPFLILLHAILQWHVTNIIPQAAIPVQMESDIPTRQTELLLIHIHGAQVLCKPLL